MLYTIAVILEEQRTNI